MCVSVCVHPSVHVCTRLFLHGHADVCMLACVRVYVFTYAVHAGVCMPVCINAHVIVHVYLCMCGCVCRVHVCAFVPVCDCM